MKNLWSLQVLAAKAKIRLFVCIQRQNVGKVDKSYTAQLKEITFI